MIKTTIVDLRYEFSQGNRTIFSRLLKKKIEDALAHKQQIIIFLNKRGFSSSLACRECGFTMKCKNCDVSMTYHKETVQHNYMLCHYCGAKQKVPTRCPHCSSAYIRFFGIGTQQVEEMLQDTFPKAVVARADRDSTRTKKGFEDIYQKLKKNEIDILIGTQIIAKGLDIENVGLIGVLLADIGFHIPDFRASERVFQLLTQVSGRTGRLGTSGEVIIQTYLPEHPAIRFASEENYVQFYEQELKERKSFNYPPFTQIIKLIYVHAEEATCLKEANFIYQQLLWLTKNNIEIQTEHLEIFLAPAFIPKQHNKYHYHVFIKGENARVILPHLTLKRGWKVDVDPVMM